MLQDEEVVPVEPTPTSWSLPDPSDATPGDELIGIGADLEPGTLLAAYRQGLFPMPLQERIDMPDQMSAPIGRQCPIGWWSPDPRGILPLDRVRVSRSLRRSLGRFEVTVDVAFDEVIRSCGDKRRPHGWIDDDITRAYTKLHELGWAHSIEVWTADDHRLAGGLYGISIGGLFAGESKFHRVTDASKVAVVALVDLLRELGYELLDTQWSTPHLETLGVIAVPRPRYLERLAAALAVDCEPLRPLRETRRFQHRA